MTSPLHSLETYRPLRLAQLVSRFPMVTETFVLYELEALKGLGVTVELYSLLRENPKVVHPEAEKWVERAHYLPWLSLTILRAHWHFIRRDLDSYMRAFFEVLRGTWGCVRCFGGVLAFFPKVVGFAYEMEKQGIRHVHAHFAYHAAVAGLIVHRLTGIPFSFTARGSDVQSDGHMLKEKVEASDFVISVSECNKEIILSKCGPSVEKKIYVIHGGVNVERLAPRLECAAGKLLRILCVARFEEVKGHAFLVEACRFLKERGVPFECRLVGDGPLRSQIENQIKQSGMSKDVLLLGSVPYDEVIEQFWRADVVVLATAPTASGKREGIPNVLKEAMACGVPVIASASGGIPELVDEQCGILVRPRDARAIADALQLLCGQPERRRQMGVAGRAKIVREFNLNLSTAKRAELFLCSADRYRPGVIPDDRTQTGSAFVTQRSA
ncbi:MAG TPA: glycosyltransferase [Candidatus Acidoferrum sp.]|nr:glycosyltransferase [Candidatus Acidoferrum sp.]